MADGCVTPTTPEQRNHSRFALRPQRPTRVDLIESKLLSSVRKLLPSAAGAQTASGTENGGSRPASRAATPNGQKPPAGGDPAPEPIVVSLVKKYKTITDKTVERRMGCVYKSRSSLLHYTQPALLATPRRSDAPPPAALLFRRETIERFVTELAGSPLGDATAASAVVLDSRTRGARAHLTEKELLREVFGVERDPASRPRHGKRKTTPKKWVEGAAGAVPSVEGSPAPPPSAPGSRQPRAARFRRRRNKNRSSGFDFLLKRKRRKEGDAENATPRNKRHLAADGPRMGADVTGSAALAAEIRSWALNRSAGETALLRASKLGYLDAVIYLLETGEDVTGCRDHASFTPLHEACARGHLDVAKTLLLYGADVNVSARGGVRPLHEAVENNHPEVVRLLLGYGSDPRLPTYAGLSPLELGAGMTTMTELLRGHIDDVEGSTAAGWKMAAATPLEPRPSGLDLWHHAPPYIARPDDSNLTFDVSATPLPAIYRRLNDSQPNGNIRYVSLAALARHLEFESEKELLEEHADLHVLDVGGESAPELVCQTLNGWRLDVREDRPARFVRLDRDVEALLKRDRFNMAV